jgi:hypothetical protein
MGKFNEYSQKATPADNDTLMIYDATAKSNKLSPFSGIWNWIVGKLTNAVISNLQTSNQTVLGAINELNSKAFQKKTNDILSVSDMDSPIQGIHFINGAEILNQNRYGVFLHFETTNNAAKYQKVITTTGETFERTYGRTTGWTGWFEK